MIDVGKNSQKSPGLSEKLQNIASMEQLLGGKESSMNKQCHRERQIPFCFRVSFLCPCAYLFVLEGLHQLRHPTEGHGEGQVGAGVAVGHLDALAAEIPLPLCVVADFILAKDVRYEVSCVKKPERGERGQVGSVAERENHFTVLSSGGLTLSYLMKCHWIRTGAEIFIVLLSLLAGVKWCIRKPKKL